MANETLIDEATKRALLARYEEPGRHYHGPAHIDALLALAGEYRRDVADPRVLEAAIWFHDAIYDSRAGDNERRSAELADEMLAGRTTAGTRDRIMAMIEATATHDLPFFEDEGARRDAALFLDMDLSILGAEPEVFDAYEEAVRREYDWVGDAAWSAGRAAVLAKFLARERIFHTREFQDRFESRARENIRRSLERLAR